MPPAGTARPKQVEAMTERQDISLYTDPAERCSARLARLYGLSPANPYRGEEASHPRRSRHPLSGIFSRLFVASFFHNQPFKLVRNRAVYFTAHSTVCAFQRLLFLLYARHTFCKLTNLTIMSRSRRANPHPCGGPFSGTARLSLYPNIIEPDHSTRQGRRHTGRSRVLRPVLSERGTTTAVSALFHNLPSGEGWQEATAVLSPFLRTCGTIYHTVSLRQHSG